MPAGNVSLSMYPYTSVKIKQALNVIDLIQISSPQAGTPLFAVETLRELMMILMMLINTLYYSLDQSGDVLEETSLHFHAWAISLVPSGVKIRAFYCRKLQAVVASEHTAEWHPFSHWEVERAASRQVSQCIRLHSESKQIAKKCTSRQFGLNMRNGIRSVII